MFISSAACGDDWILCAIGSGIALLALGADETSTGTPDSDGRVIGTADASDDAGGAGGRSFAEGIAVGGERLSAVHWPLEAAGMSPDDDAADGSVGGVTGAGSILRAAAVAEAAAIGAGVCARSGGGRGGVACTFAIGGGVGTRGTLPTGTRGIAAGVGTRGAVIDFGRGAPAGVGTIGFGLPGSDGGR